MKHDQQQVAEGILLTDQYQLTMAQLYYRQGLQDKTAQFDHFYRSNPDYGQHQAGYCINAGLEWLLDWMSEVKVTDQDLSYLRAQETNQGERLFEEDFLDWLISESLFAGITMQAVPEGRVVHPDVPLTVVQGPLPRAQLLETSLLNHLNYQTLIATKASRIHQSGGENLLLEFGLRRGPEKGAIAGTRAALIGGADYSSNVGISQVLGYPPKGTHAHSMVQVFMALGGDELDAFRAYADVYPDDCLLLVDTVDTLESGIPNAIKVFEELRAQGHQPVGIRLDSGDFAFLSIQARKMLGQTHDELVGSLWNDLLGDQRSGFEAALLDVHEQRHVTTEMKIPTPAGLRILEVHMTTIDYGGREAIQWIGHDVTEQIELERMRDDLMHMIVHDLRNPLGNVISSLQMMRTALIEDDNTLPMMDVLRVAMRSSEKLRRLIDSLLSLRQLEEGKADLDRRLVPPIVLTREAVEMVRPMINKKEQHLILDIPPDISPVRVDRDMVSRVLTNLLDNAAKFTPTEGKIKLQIAERDDKLLFVVSDTGPGIPLESQENIFERFTRLESAKGTQGTGLGLPFCKLAVEAHGGKIWVESTPGEGSEFKFTLPLEGR